MRLAVWGMRVAVLAAFVLFMGCETTAGGDDGTTAGGLELVSSAKPVLGAWFVPMNASNNSIALFSEQREPFTLTNKTGAAVTIKSMALSLNDGVVSEEWSLQKYDIKALPLEVDGSSLAAGGTLDFYVRFYPVLGAERKAILKIDTDGGALEIALTGRGAPESAWPAGTTVTSEKVLGAPTTTELAGALAVDATGNQYVTANVDFSTNKAILVTKVNVDHQLEWAKVFDGSYADVARDPGQNGETGGSSGSLGLDAEGNAYFSGGVSGTASNNIFYGAVSRVAPDGSLAWSKLLGFGPIKMANQNIEFYGLDASGSEVLAVGTTGGTITAEAGVVIVSAFDKADGTLKAAKGFDLHTGFTDRAYVVRPDGQGGAYLCGFGGSAGMLMRVKDVATNPTLDWAKEIPLGTGGNLNSLDVDTDGNVYVGLDFRGALTSLGFAKFGPDGQLAWAKSYSGNSGDKNNVQVVRVYEGKLWVGGRIGTPNFDGQMGDGLVARVAFDGTLEYSAFHYSGKGPDELAEHRVKGIFFNQGKLNIASQVYTGSMNGVRYNGYWYAGQGTLGAVTLDIKDVPAPTEVPLDKAVAEDAAATVQWKDAPASLVLQDAKAKHDGKAPDSDVMLTTLAVQ